MIKSARIKTLNDNILYKNCIPEWRQVIDNHKTEIAISKGKTVFKEADLVKSIFFIIKGTIKIHQRWGAGKELIIRFAKEGDMIGYRGLGKEKVYPVTATALDDARLMAIPISFLEDTLRVNPLLTYALMDFYANELETTEKRMRNMAHMEVRGRMAEALLLLQDKFGETDQGFINIKLTKQDIASYVGTTYETISRMVSELENRQLIKTQGKYIGLLKKRQLHDLINPLK